jgi:hypothetical protein
MMAAVFAVLSFTAIGQTQRALAGTLDGVVGPVPASVVVGGNTTLTVSFHDDAGTSAMNASVGAPNNFIFISATVVPVCSASTSGIGTGTVTLTDATCDANNVADPFTWTLTLKCTAANPVATPTTPITVSSTPATANNGITVQASCTAANTPPPTQVFECFNTQRGPDAAATVRLVTQNFGGDLVRVRNLVMMCELAFKVKPTTTGTTDSTPLPDPAQTRIFACYRLERGDDPNDPFTLATDNFGIDRVVVRDSNLLCEEGTKTRVTQPTAGGPSVTTVTGTETGVVWQCYRLAQTKEANAPFRLLTNNFGRENVSVGRGVMMCEEAAKQRPDAAGKIVETGKATGKVQECFSVRSNADPKASVTLETKNFGKANTVVRRPVMMCELGTKTPVFTFPAAENPRPEETALGADD